MDDDIPLANAYRMNGEFFVRSARTLSEKCEIDPDGYPTTLPSVPMYYLASHAAELFLKATLLERGLTEKAVTTLRHDLCALLKALNDKGVNVGDSTTEFIARLSPQHKSHWLRYDVLVKRGVGTYWPSVDLVFSSLKELRML